MRIWAAGCCCRYKGWRGRLKFARKPLCMLGKARVHRGPVPFPPLPPGARGSAETPSLSPRLHELPSSSAEFPPVPLLVMTAQGTGSSWAWGHPWHLGCEGASPLQAVEHPGPWSSSTPVIVTAQIPHWLRWGWEAWLHWRLRIASMGPRCAHFPEVGTEAHGAESWSSHTGRSIFHPNTRVCTNKPLYCPLPPCGWVLTQELL